MSLTGGLGLAATTCYRRLASLLATKWNQPYSKTMSWLRCRLAFSLLHSSIMCIRGTCSSCGHATKLSTLPIDLAIHESSLPTISKRSSSSSRMRGSSQIGSLGDATVLLCFLQRIFLGTPLANPTRIDTELTHSCFLRGLFSHLHGLKLGSHGVRFPLRCHYKHTLPNTWLFGPTPGIY